MNHDLKEYHKSASNHNILRHHPMIGVVLPEDDFEDDCQNALDADFEAAIEEDDFKDVFEYQVIKNAFKQKVLDPIQKSVIKDFIKSENLYTVKIKSAFNVLESTYDSMEVCPYSYRNENLTYAVVNKKYYALEKSLLVSIPGALEFSVKVIYLLIKKIFSKDIISLIKKIPLLVMRISFENKTALLQKIPSINIISLIKNIYFINISPINIILLLRKIPSVFKETLINTKISLLKIEKYLLRDQRHVILKQGFPIFRKDPYLIKENLITFKKMILSVEQTPETLEETPIIFEELVLLLNENPVVLTKKPIILIELISTYREEIIQNNMDRFLFEPFGKVILREGNVDLVFDNVTTIFENLFSIFDKDSKLNYSKRNYSKRNYSNDFTKTWIEKNSTTLKDYFRISIDLLENKLHLLFDNVTTIFENLFSIVFENVYSIFDDRFKNVFSIFDEDSKRNCSNDFTETWIEKNLCKKNSTTLKDYFRIPIDLLEDTPVYAVVNRYKEIVTFPQEGVLKILKIEDFIKNISIPKLNLNLFRKEPLVLFFMHKEDAEIYYHKLFKDNPTTFLINEYHVQKISLASYYVTKELNPLTNIRLVADLEEVAKILNNYRRNFNNFLIKMHPKQKYSKGHYFMKPWFHGVPIYVIQVNRHLNATKYKSFNRVFYGKERWDPYVAERLMYLVFFNKKEALEILNNICDMRINKTIYGIYERMRHPWGELIKKPYITIYNLASFLSDLNKLSTVPTNDLNELRVQTEIYVSSGKKRSFQYNFPHTALFNRLVDLMMFPSLKVATYNLMSVPNFNLNTLDLNEAFTTINSLEKYEEEEEEEEDEEEREEREEREEILLQLEKKLIKKHKKTNYTKLWTLNIAKTIKQLFNLKDWEDYYSGKRLDNTYYYSRSPYQFFNPGLYEISKYRYQGSIHIDYIPVEVTPYEDFHTIKQQVFSILREFRKVIWRLKRCPREYPSWLHPSIVETMKIIYY